MKTRKILALLMAVLMLVGCLAACGGDGGSTTETQAASGSTGDAVVTESWTEEQIAQMGEAIKGEAGGSAVSLKIWGPELAQDVLKSQAEAFKALFADYADINLEVAVQGENDAAANIINDPKAAADVFGFPSDQLTKLNNANALAECYFPENVTADNTAASVAAASVDGKVMAYPETGDNSYILVYDKSLVSDEQAKSLEGVFEACEAAKKKFIMDSGNGFFTCMYLYTGGLVTEGFEEDGMTQKFNDYDINQVTASVKAFADLFTANKDYFESADTTAVADGFKNGTTAAGIAGSWNIAAVKEALGDNAGFAILPTININGTDTQIINMFGYKFIGVNSQSSYPITAQILAYYLTNEDCQMQRAEKLDWAPSNAAAQDSDFVKNNASMSALMAQTEFSIPQTALAGTFWDPLAALGTYMIEPTNDFSTEAVQAEVEACIAGIRDE